MASVIVIMASFTQLLPRYGFDASKTRILVVTSNVFSAYLLVQFVSDNLTALC